MVENRFWKKLHIKNLQFEPSKYHLKILTQSFAPEEIKRTIDFFFLLFWGTEYEHYIPFKIKSIFQMMTPMPVVPCTQPLYRTEQCLALGWNLRLTSF